jgi:hypothetical protein
LGSGGAGIGVVADHPAEPAVRQVQRGPGKVASDRADIDGNDAASN